MPKQTRTKRKTLNKSPIVKPIVEQEITSDTIIAAIHKATESQKPPKFLMGKLTKMQNELSDLSTSMERVQKENDALKIEVLKYLNYSGGINTKILELLTLQNNSFQSRVYTPTPRRNSPFIFQGTPTGRNL